MDQKKQANISVDDVMQLFNSGKVVLFKCSIQPDYPITFISRNVDEVLGYSQSYFLDNQQGWSSQIHPDDKEEALGSFDRVLSTGSAVNEYRYKTKSGKYVWLRDRMCLKRNEENEPESIVGYSWLVARELELDHQQGKKIRPYEHAIARCSHLLLNNQSQALQKTLQILREVANADRAYIFENHTSNDGTLICSQTHEACADNITSQIDNPELQNVPYSVFPWWEQELSRHRIINELVRNMPSPEKELLEPQGIQSLLIIPIYVEGEWFGFIGFDDVREERYWTPDEVVLLQLAAKIIGSYKKWIRAQDQLKVQKNLNQAVIDSLPGIFVMTDEQGKCVKWNQNFIREMGYSESEITEMKARDIFRSDNSELLDHVIQSVKKGKVQELEVNPLAQSGEKVPFNMKAVPFESADRQYIIWNGYNISEQKKMLQEIKRNEELFKSLFSKAPVAIIMEDQDNRLKRVNQSFESLFGYKEDEVIGKNIDDILVPPGEGAVDVASEKKINTERNYYTETKRCRKNGETVDVLVAGIPVFVEDKRIANFSMYIDISDLKNVEEELRDSLNEKQILLQEIHHRVKNNLAVVSSLLQLQIFEVEEPSFKRMLQESQSRIQTMALIHEKLYRSNDLSRIPLKTYIPELVESIRQTFDMGKTNINVEINIDDVELNINKAIPFALFINEVITNSFEHAFRDSDDGEIHVEVFMEDEELVARVYDNGHGMASVFDEPSDGLGMTLIKGFINQLDAEYSIDTENGVCYTIAFSPRSTKGSSTMFS